MIFPQFLAPARTATARRIFVIGTALLWLALIMGYAGHWAWPLDLFAHFRLQYAIGFAVCALTLAVLKALRVAAIASAGALLCSVSLFSYAGLFTSSMVQGSVDFRLMSFNTWFRNRDHARLVEYLRETRADVVILQEITAQQTLRLQQQLPEYPHAFTESAKPHGATLLSRWPIHSAAVFELTPDGVRAAQVKVNWRGRFLNIIGVHLHWPIGPDGSRMRNRELSALATGARNLEGPVLIAGDFNTTPWSQHYRGFLASSALHDCARGHRLGLTWPAQFPPLGLRIDHCFASTHWEVVDVRSGPYLGSDHRPMIAELRLQH